MNNSEVIQWVKEQRNLAQQILDDRKQEGYDRDHAKKNVAMYDAILAALGGPSEEGFCDCDNYKWLDKELKGEAVFLSIHGWKIENRGPFKFCPYCGKRLMAEAEIKEEK